LNGEICQRDRGICTFFWDQGFPVEINIKVCTKKGFVRVYNACRVDVCYINPDEEGNLISTQSQRIDYCQRGTAMIVEEIENGRRYRCSDVFLYEKEDPFGDIVFTVQRTDSTNNFPRKKNRSLRTEQLQG